MPNLFSVRSIRQSLGFTLLLGLATICKLEITQKRWFESLGLVNTKRMLSACPAYPAKYIDLWRVYDCLCDLEPGPDFIIVNRRWVDEMEKAFKWIPHICFAHDPSLSNTTLVSTKLKRYINIPIPSQAPFRLHTSLHTREVWHQCVRRRLLCTPQNNRHEECPLFSGWLIMTLSCRFTVSDAPYDPRNTHCLFPCPVSWHEVLKSMLTIYAVFLIKSNWLLNSGLAIISWMSRCGSQNHMT